MQTQDEFSIKIETDPIRNITYVDLSKSEITLRGKKLKEILHWHCWKIHISKNCL